MANILVVDDSEALRTSLSRDLETEGHTVFQASDGPEALEKLKEISGLTLMIADVNMPIMDGLTLSKKVREGSKYSQLPIFILTTEATMEMKIKGKYSGVNAWIVKPYNIEKLCKVIDQISSKNAAA